MVKDQISNLKDDILEQIKFLNIINEKTFFTYSQQSKDIGVNSLDLFIKDKKITSEKIIKEFSKKYSIPFKLTPEIFNPMITKFPHSYCLKNSIIPIGQEGNKLEMGICHPSSLNALKNLSLMIDKKIEAYFVPPQFIFDALNQRHIHASGEKEKAKIIAEETKSNKIEDLAKAKEVIDINMAKLETKKDDEVLDLSKLRTKEEKQKKIDESTLNVSTAAQVVEDKQQDKPLTLDLTKLKQASKEIEKKTENKSAEKTASGKLDLKSAIAKASGSTNQMEDEPELNISTKRKSSAKNDDLADIPAVTGDVLPVVDEILSKAVATNVSDIHIEIFKDIAQIRFRKNGSLLSQPQYKKFISDNYAATIARVKILANLDIAERRLPQDGKISYTTKQGTEVDFRISVLPTNLGERIVIRILDSSSLAVSVEQIGFTKAQLKEFLKAIDAPQGMILVTGPTGSGKSTTLYGAMNYLNSPDVNILTAEDPVEYTMPGISQVQVREDIGLTFASALRSFLRQDPEIILVGEIRDSETADIASKAALTGHLVLSTLHTNSAIGAISRLVNMGLPPYLVSSALSLVVAQRLVRINCPFCIEDVDKSHADVKKFLKDYSVNSSANLKQSKGCAECSHTGYKGRKGVHEVITITSELEHAISSGKSEAELLKIANSDGFSPISKSALRFLEDGTLSMEEYLRVIPQED